MSIAVLDVNVLGRSSTEPTSTTKTRTATPLSHNLRHGLQHDAEYKY
jgi:hypothetical protein